MRKITSLGRREDIGVAELLIGEEAHRGFERIFHFCSLPVSVKCQLCAPKYAAAVFLNMLWVGGKRRRFNCFSDVFEPLGPNLLKADGNDWVSLFT